VILFDGLVSVEILDFARREAKKILICENGQPPHQGAVDAMIVSLARAGRRVVRLKGGDPAAEADASVAACRAAGIAVEIVPGVDTHSPAHVDRAAIA
jgi:uroporphyrin-III C-methyltransferase / precorrin-2 dehydrogenase / sirohydrochlorin ferrochelatase